jgi:hypothetical protein
MLIPYFDVKQNQSDEDFSHKFLFLICNYDINLLSTVTAKLLLCKTNVDKLKKGFLSEALFIWWVRAELNCRHSDFQSDALPTELPTLVGFAAYGEKEGFYL